MACTKKAQTKKSENGVALTARARTIADAWTNPAKLVILDAAVAAPVARMHESVDFVNRRPKVTGDEGVRQLFAIDKT